MKQLAGRVRPGDIEVDLLLATGNVLSFVGRKSLVVASLHDLHQIQLILVLQAGTPYFLMMNSVLKMTLVASEQK